MKSRLLPLVLSGSLVLAVAFAANPASASRGDDEDDRAQFPNVIADINRHRLAFTAFDGDLKNGKERCDQPQYDLAAQNFAAFRDPLVYVPGDNEWTDCDRPSNGSYDPNERLALVRRMFAATPQSLGQRTLRLERQSADYPENVRWARGPVTYVGLNVPGSDNNAPQFDATGKQVDGDAAEYTARNAANLAWLDSSFAAARDAHSAAVMVVLQADMWSAGQNHWVSATVDAHDPDVFTFHQHVVAANVPVYVKP